ncbi:hypothetical protein BALOs_2815 [Halobacteriovorax sp. BALOs_7]|uniref:hypothetical protein n=1 Tax=Halobacteriovorax sp. BALOs_7 TaxID=2109558 RepID=UPI000EA1F028|nr:hypothetical protein [Halobacteriovorax sp. BALOs_7]AYF45804.1 hypothetical protein BALOs_2815 [Halobacteriovorax sp. BALOs_7]
MLKRLTLAFLLTQSVLSLPDTVEFVFISPAASNKTTLLDSKIINYRKVAQNEKENCVPMGEGCFDPQKGYIQNDKAVDYVDQEYGKVNKKVEVENTIESSMIRCTGAYFDIFCGKAKKVEEKPKSKYEIWIDTSASLRRADWSKSGDTCYRRSFVSRLSHSCPLTIKAFDSSLKEIANDLYLCQTKGGNNTKKIIRWVKNSNAKHLFVLTDIDEANGELTDFLSNIGAKVHGVGTKPFYPEDLFKLADNLKATCQK